MDPRTRLEQIARIRQAVIADGEPPDASGQTAWGERAWIVESWHRCLARGARPEQAVAFAPVSRQARARHAEANAALLEAARPQLRRLAANIAPIRYFALLTDARGVVLETAGCIDRRDPHAHAIARIGVDLSEGNIGTSAIGAALHERMPIWLHRGEHFFRDTSVYSCAGAPLFDPAGECIGMVDVTGVNAQERPELRHLVAQAAQQIEDALVLARPHRLRLHLGWPASDSSEGGLLCLDGDGCVTGSNRTARQMLPALHELAQGPLHAETLFALPWPELFDLARQGASRIVPLWSGLRVRVTAQLAPEAGHGIAQAHAQGRRDLRPPLKTLEIELIHQAVREAGGRVAEAARALGISRATVYRRLASARQQRKRD